MGPIRFSYASKLWGSAMHNTAGAVCLFFYPSFTQGSYEYLLLVSFAEEYAEISKLGVTRLYVSNHVPTLSSPCWEPLQAVTQGRISGRQQQMGAAQWWDGCLASAGFDCQQPDKKLHGKFDGRFLLLLLFSESFKSFQDNDL